MSVILHTDRWPGHIKSISQRQGLHLPIPLPYSLPISNFQVEATEEPRFQLTGEIRDWIADNLHGRTALGWVEGAGFRVYFENVSDQALFRVMWS